MHALVQQISTDFIQTIFEHLVTYKKIFILIRVPVHTFLLKEGNFVQDTFNLQTYKIRYSNKNIANISRLVMIKLIAILGQYILEAYVPINTVERYLYSKVMLAKPAHYFTTKYSKSHAFSTYFLFATLVRVTSIELLQW